MCQHLVDMSEREKRRILPVMFVGVASPECKDFENILLEYTEMDSCNLPILVLNGVGIGPLSKIVAQV